MSDPHPSKLPDEQGDGPSSTERFLALLMSNQRRVHAFILSLVPNRNDADDLLQESIIVMWRKFESFQPGTDFLAWAMAIARFEVMRHRQKHARSKLVFGEDLLDSLAAMTLAKSEQFEARHDALERCLGKLSDRDRELITLRYQEGLAIKEVASRVGRPAGGMYKAMARVHTALSLCVRKVIREAE